MKVFSGQAAAEPDPPPPPPTFWESTLESVDKFFEMSYMQRMAGFAMTLISGLVMMGLASMYLPMVVIGMPQKFAFTYALSNLLLLLSSCFMVGPKKQVENMMQRHRAVAAIAWLTSTIGLLYVVWRMRFFLYVGIALTIQVSSLLLYVGTYLPWGNSVVVYILKTWISVSMKICKGVFCFCFNRGGSSSSSGSSLLPM
uniref:Vesicle transport protein n=1 Tax=Lotharella oceanica TaxID=641309 RepID=A0A7S2TR41_9EUKA|eukprot:CAMPEP_0170180500 /NCGR_PEP_ID=MMETSP0040_2-20121228/22094_1 /TAXON_ID=641309 /ORGANISM="Lotharella oceanica, Strain CCMP622" /LENGTH=198 /DNA_ID=CAMNT_0010425155 /DNA_START=26 /DNA_END=622 /DNA_ORIENTATION=+